MSKFKPLFAIAGLFLILEIYFGTIAISRFVAWDEGFYVLATKLVREGSLPYIDFFYPQAPLFPYLLNIITPLGLNWATLRISAATCAALLGTLLWINTQPRYGRQTALIVLIFYLGSHLIFGWYTTIQTYSMSALLLFLAYHLHSSPKANQQLIAGLLLGLAINTRAYLLVTTPLFLMRSGTQKQPKRFLLGVCLGVLPAALLLAYDPQAFWFNNWEYHQLRSQLDLLSGLPYKLLLLKKMFLLEPCVQFYGYEFLCLSCLIAATITLTALKKFTYYPALGIGLSLIAISWIPTPNYLQYFCLPVPFILAGCAPTISYCLQSKVGKPLLAGLMLLFLANYSQNLQLYTVTGLGLTGINNPEEAHLKNLRGIREVRDAIARSSKPSDVIFSYWPGFLLELPNQALNGSENHFTFRVADKIASLEERQHLKLLSKTDSVDLVRRGVPDLLVLQNRAAGRLYRQAILEGGYKRLETLSGISIYGLATSTLSRS